MEAALQLALTERAFHVPQRVHFPSKVVELCHRSHRGTLGPIDFSEESYFNLQ